MRFIEVPTWFKLEVQRNLDMQSLSPEPDHPDIILYRRKIFPVFCLFFRKAQWFVFGDRSTRTLTWKKSSGIVLSRTQLLFWLHFFVCCMKHFTCLKQISTCCMAVFLCDSIFVSFSMLHADFVRFIVAGALNFLCFLTILYCMRSCNKQNV